MDFVRSEIVIFDVETGAKVMLAPASLAPTDPKQAWVALPADFSEATHSWDELGRAMVTDLDKLRAQQWSIIKDARERAQVGGCVTALGEVDTDPASQLKIAGSVQMAMLAQAAGQPFAVDWTMHDDSIVSHDAAAMIGMGMAVGQHIRACHELAVTKRAQIEAATDQAAIAAVTWPQDSRP